jgi:WD40 repeat protein
MNAAPLIRYPSLGAVKAAHRQLLERFSRRDRGGDSVPRDVLLDEAEQLMRDGAVTGKVVADEADRRAIQSILDYWTTVLYRADRNPADAIVAEYDPSLSPTIADADCPYLGLDAFGEADATRFFGRSATVADALERLRTGRLLVVVGPSGSGKSSLVRAGIVAALKRGALEGSASWRYCAPFTPGALRSSPRSLADFVAGAGDRPVVVVVDQFEELFTYGGDEREGPRPDAGAFIAALVALATSDGPTHRVVIAMRTDFENNIAHFPELAKLFADGRLEVHPLTAAELRDTIERPAEQVGLKFQEGVVDDLLRGLVGEPAALPLLQFTLLQLWNHRQGSLVTWEAYRAATTGRAQQEAGARWALANSADVLYEQLIPEDQETLRWILLQLVQPGEGLEFTSRRVARDALEHGGPASDRVQRVLDKLLGAHLLRESPGPAAGEVQVEVAHEALIRNWPRLNGWLADERRRTRQRRRLRSAVDMWNAHGRDPGALWGGALLEEAWAYSDTTADERAFLAASTHAQRQRELTQRRVTHLSWALAGVLALIAATLGVSWSRAQSEAVNANSRALAAQATSLLNSQLDRALPLNVRADRMHPASEAHRALRSALIQNFRLTDLLRADPPSAPLAVRFPDASHVRALTVDGSLIDWDLSAGGAGTETSVAPDGAALAALDDSGARLAYTRADQLVVWDVEHGRQMGEPIQVAGGSPGIMAWSGDLLVVAAGRSISLWRVTDALGSPQLEKSFDSDASVLLLATSRDGANLAWTACDSARCEQSVRLLHVDRAPDGEPTWTPGSVPIGVPQVTSLAFNADGSSIAVGAVDGTIQIWDIAHHTPAEPLRQDGSVQAVAFSRDGSRIASGNEAGDTFVWDTATSRQLGPPLNAHLATARHVLHLAFSPNGTQLVSGYEYGTPVVLWDVDAVRIDRVTATSISAIESNTATSSDGRVSATVDCGMRALQAASGPCIQGRVVLRTQGTPSPTTLLAHDDEATRIAFSRDGSLLASASPDGTLVLWDVAAGQQIGAPIDLPERGRVSALVFDDQGSLSAQTRGYVFQLRLGQLAEDDAGERTRGRACAIVGGDACVD